MSGVKTVLVGTIGQGIMRSADGASLGGASGSTRGCTPTPWCEPFPTIPNGPEWCSPDGQGAVPQRRRRAALAVGGHGDERLLRLGLGHRLGGPKPDVRRDRHSQPRGVFRSTDGGQTWEKRPVEVAEECPNVGVPRVTGIAIDPLNHRDVWVGLEVDGLRHSANSGDTWESINGAIPNPDVHNVAVAAGPPKTVVVVVNNDVYTSADNGGSWERLGIREVFPLTYPRESWCSRTTPT